MGERICKGCEKGGDGWEGGVRVGRTIDLGEVYVVDVGGVGHVLRGERGLGWGRGGEVPLLTRSNLPRLGFDFVIERFGIERIRGGYLGGC